MKWRLVLVLSMALAFVLWGSCARKPAPPAKGELVVTLGKDGIPSVNAEIVQFRSSPDCTLVALVLKEAESGERGNRVSHYWVMIFDPAKKEMVAQTSKPSDCSIRDLYWSSDGKWLAVTSLSQSEDMSLLCTDGTFRGSVATGAIRDLLWREDAPGRFLYVKSEDRRTVHEYDVGSHNESRHPTQHYLVSLFTVKGKPCVGYYADTPTYDPEKEQTLYAAEFESRKVIAQIPLYSLTTDDVYNLDVSPDGQYFFLPTGYTSPTRYTVARIADAGSVLGNPHEAIAWQDRTSGDYVLIWPKSAPDQGKADWHVRTALVEAQDKGFSLDLSTGSRYDWHYPGLRFVDWWKSTEWEDSSGNTYTADYLVLDGQGLQLCDLEFDQLLAERLVLRHQMQEDD